MSANFIIRYAGRGVRFRGGLYELVGDDRATPFISETEAIIKARDEGLNLNHVKVVNLHLLNLQIKS